MTWTRRQKKSQKLFYSRLKNCALVVLIGPNCSLCPPAAQGHFGRWTFGMYWNLVHYPCRNRSGAS